MADNRTLLEEELRNLLKLFATADARQFLDTLHGWHLEPSVKRILRLYKPLQSVDTSLFPDEALARLLTDSRRIYESLQDLKELCRPDVEAAEVSRRLAQLNGLVEKLFGSFGALILVAQETRDEKARLQRAAEDYRRTADEQSEEAGRLLEELKQIKDSAKSMAEQVGVARHEVLFAQVAEEHRHSATRWLVATIALGGVTAIAVIWSIWSVFYHAAALAKFTVPMAIQLGVAKVVAFSILVTALLWSGRMYRAHRHNYVVNRHRQNALTTFETFAQSARDAQTKAAVLLQATQSIFMPQSTGYLKEESEGGGPQPAIELMRTVSSA